MADTIKRVARLQSGIQSCSSKTSNEVVVVGEIAASPPTYACLSAIIQPSLLLYIILGGLLTETNEGRKEINGRRGRERQQT